MATDDEKTKGKKPRDPDLFGGTPPPPRYENPSENRRKWTAREQLALWPALLVATCLWDYMATCRKLAEALGRTPAAGSISYSADKEEPCDRALVLRRGEGGMENECTSLVNRRVVTAALQEPDAVGATTLGAAFVLRTGRRAGLALSWAERSQFLWTWAANPNNKSRVDLPSLSWVLDRTAADLPMLEEYAAYVSRLTAGCPTRERPEWGVRETDAARERDLGAGFAEVIRRMADTGTETAYRTLLAHMDAHGG